MTEDRTFDRRVSYDVRSLEYPVRPLLLAGPAQSYTWRHVQLDQGSEGACTGFAVTMEAAARPVPVFGDPVRQPPDVAALDVTARATYRRAQVLDEFPDTPPAEGSSVLAAMKVGAENGWWTEYRWALGPGAALAADDVCRSIRRGPVVMGTWWRGGMWEVDSDGFLHASGEYVGGHAYLLTAYSRSRDAVWTPNSWGGAGQGWISRADLTVLLDESGEAALPVVRSRP